MIVCTETDYNISLIDPCQCKNLTSIIINNQVANFKDLFNNRKVNCLWHFASLWLKYLARYFQRISQNKNRLHFVFTLSLKVTKYTSKKLWTISFMTQLSPPAPFIRFLPDSAFVSICRAHNGICVFEVSRVKKSRQRVSNADRKLVANPESFCNKLIIG